MGSFNTTCFASGQTIAPEEECFVLPIVQQGGYRPVELELAGEKHSLFGIANNTCHVNSFWTPVGGFLEAEYEDCGQFTLENTERNMLLMFEFVAKLSKSAAITKQGENTSHDVPFNLQDFILKNLPLLAGMLYQGQNAPQGDEGRAALFNELVKAWEHISEAIWEHRLFVKTANNGLRPVQYAVMHKAGYEGLIAMASKMKTWDKSSMDQRAHVERALKAYDDVELPVRATPLAPEVEASLNGYFRLQAFNEAFRDAGSDSIMHFACESVDIEDAIELYHGETVDNDAFFEHLKPALDARYVMMGLEILNLKITPQVYAGQDYDNSIGRAYAKFVRATSAAVSLQRRNDRM